MWYVDLFLKHPLATSIALALLLTGALGILLSPQFVGGSGYLAMEYLPYTLAGYLCPMGRLLYQEERLGIQATHTWISCCRIWLYGNT